MSETADPTLQDVLDVLKKRRPEPKPGQETGKSDEEDRPADEVSLGPADPHGGEAAADFPFPSSLRYSEAGKMGNTRPPWWARQVPPSRG